MTAEDKEMPSPEHQPMPEGEEQPPQAGGAGHRGGA